MTDVLDRVAYTPALSTSSGRVTVPIKTRRPGGDIVDYDRLATVTGGVELDNVFEFASAPLADPPPDQLDAAYSRYAEQWSAEDEAISRALRERSRSVFLDDET